MLNFLDTIRNGKTLSGDNPAFFLDFQYRIKRREPVNGEVWITAGMPCIYSEYAVNDYELLQFDGGDAHHFNADAVYAASSVEAYIARNILSKINESEAADVQTYTAHNLLIEAAGEDK